MALDPEHDALLPTQRINPGDLKPELEATLLAAGPDAAARFRATLDRFGAAASPYSSLGNSPREFSESRGRALLKPLRPLTLSRGIEVETTGHSAELVAVGTLGEGGMGVVELAQQPALGREVAVKRLRSELAGELHVHALLDEARITGSLEHPNILPVHGVGLDPAHGPLVVMKRVQGQTWNQLLAADREVSATPGRLDSAQLSRHLRALMQVCNALEFAHSKDIIHRDIKPANVMLGEFGEVYLLDWGIALRLAAESAGDSPETAGFGTPVYMAPEMVLGRGIDGRSDVYLLGATLHELLTGQPRHTGKSLAACFADALTSDPFEYPVEIPSELGAICNRACHREPERRYQSAGEFRQAIGDYLERRDAHALVTAASNLTTELEQITTPTSGAVHAPD